MRSTFLAVIVAALMCFLAIPSSHAQGVGTSAGVRGTVKQILAEDSQLVEFGQPLFVIEPLN